MRIAFIVNNYPPHAGGVELHVQALAKELIVLGDDVRVYTLGKDTGVFDDEGVEVICLPERMRIADTLGFPLLGTKRKIKKSLAAWQPEVISVHTRFFPMSLIGIQVGCSLGVPVVHTEHGSDFVRTSSTVIDFFAKLVDRTIGKYVIHKASHVLGVSEAVANFVRRLSGRQPEVFYNAIAPLPTPRNISINPLRLVFVGRLVSGKGATQFVELVSQLRDAGYDVSASIAGDGPERDSVLATINNFDCGDRVELLGRISPKQVRELLQGAILVNPTTLSEGFQTTILEALSVKGAVVTYDVPGARKLAAEGAPISITNQSNQTELFTLTRALIEKQQWIPFPETKLAEWYWPQRAAQYKSILLELC